MIDVSKVFLISNFRRVLNVVCFLLGNSPASEVSKVAEKIKTHILCSITFFFLNLAAYEIMLKNIVEPDRPQMTIWRTRFACWITKATNTHSEYVILIAFLLQQWWHERPSTLHMAYLACIVMVCLYFNIILVSLQEFNEFGRQNVDLGHGSHVCQSLFRRSLRTTVHAVTYYVQRRTLLHAQHKNAPCPVYRTEPWT
jgi:hypothetical protein